MAAAKAEAETLSAQLAEAAEQLQALRAHGLAHTSLGPITAAMHAAHKAAAPTGDWLSTVYFQDSTHPSRFARIFIYL